MNRRSIPAIATTRLHRSVRHNRFPETGSVIGRRNASYMQSWFGNREQIVASIAAIIEDVHEPWLKVNNENVCRTDLKDLRRHFRYRYERNRPRRRYSSYLDFWLVGC